MKSTVQYLEMTSEEEFCPSEIPEGFELREVRDPAINKRFYREVGGPWQWTDRLGWKAEKWNRWAMRPEVSTWLAFTDGEEAGFVEFKRQEKGSVEVVCFGLLPAMIGRRLGSPMLSAAILRAWEIPDTKRVWLHTCSEDHPHAFSNYEKRGFRLFKTEEVSKKNDEAN